MIKAFLKINSNFKNKLRNSLNPNKTKLLTSFRELINSGKEKKKAMESNMQYKSTQNLRQYLNSVSSQSNLTDKNKNILAVLSFISSKSFKGKNSEKSQIEKVKVASYNEKIKKKSANSIDKFKMNRHKWISESKLDLKLR